VRVLIVEDSRAMRAIISRIFEKLGAVTCPAVNGQDGLDLLAKDSNFDLALVDWNMPKLNGLEFVRAVRSNDAYSNIKLMMATTETEIERVMQALEEGADEYVMKPFTKEILADKLRLLGLLDD
jgi:two-component system, chemotaxis family, chemotaxis protein CheY